MIAKVFSDFLQIWMVMKFHSVLKLKHFVESTTPSRHLSSGHPSSARRGNITYIKQFKFSSCQEEYPDVYSQGEVVDNSFCLRFYTTPPSLDSGTPPQRGGETFILTTIEYEISPPGEEEWAFTTQEWKVEVVGYNKTPPRPDIYRRDTPPQRGGEILLT